MKAKAHGKSRDSISGHICKRKSAFNLIDKPKVTHLNSASFEACRNLDLNLKFRSGKSDVK